MNNEINYLPTGARYLPSTVRQVPKLVLFLVNHWLIMERGTVHCTVYFQPFKKQWATSLFTYATVKTTKDSIIFYKVGAYTLSKTNMFNPENRPVAGDNVFQPSIFKGKLADSLREGRAFHSGLLDLPPGVQASSQMKVEMFIVLPRTKAPGGTTQNIRMI